MPAPKRVAAAWVRAVNVLRHLHAQVFREHALNLPEPAIQAVLRDKFIVRSKLNDPAFLKHRDPVGVHKRRKPVGDNEHRVLAALAAKLIEDRIFGIRVHGAQCVIENHDRRIFEQRGRSRLVVAARRKGLRRVRRSACRTWRRTIRSIREWPLFSRR